MTATTPRPTTPMPIAPEVATPSPLATDGLRRQIGGRAVVDDVTLSLTPGELLVLVGPSGCGKSSLLRLVAGLDAPDGGRVLLDGTDVTGRAPEQRRVGLVFQDHALFPHLRVAQNVGFGLRSLPKRQRERRVDELLELVRLPGTGRRYPHQLSGGEQQRIALARALAAEPTVVLLDEPFASLDASLRDDLRDDVVDVLRRRGTTAVLVTHERDEALALGDRVAVMDEGRIVQVGTPQDVYRRPATAFVAGFLGDATVLHPDELPGAAGSAAGRWMARPEDVTVVAGGSAVVVARRYLGARWRLEVRRPDGTTALADTDDDGALAVGAPCTLVVIRPDRLHLLH